MMRFSSGVLALFPGLCVGGKPENETTGVPIIKYYIVLFDVFMYIFDTLFLSYKGHQHLVSIFDVICHLSQVTRACTLCMDIGGD